jgi:beta-aspartyl-peptidase (threonine type)
MKACSYLIIVWILSLLYCESNKANRKDYALVMHGGAGTIEKSLLSDSLEKAYRNTLSSALNKGQFILQNNGSSTDAVEMVISILEDSPLFNAGKGSFYSNAGNIEMDASIMNGRNKNAGAIAGVQMIKNPIKAARLVMDSSRHVMLSGKGADLYAKANGLELAESSYFATERRWNQLLKIRNKNKSELDHSYILDSLDKKYGTVGCVALDKFGNISAGISTGGMSNKQWGRIGDSPIIGAGTYANNYTCGVSCTGNGEYYIRNLFNHSVSDLIEIGNFSLKDALNKVIHSDLEKTGGKGGIIAIDNKGNINWDFNTAGMYRGMVDEKGNITIEIYKK